MRGKKITSDNSQKSTSSSPRVYRFGNKKSFGFRNFSAAALKELTYASDEVVEQVLNGDVLSTSMAIREAEKARRKAEEELKQARIAEAKASTDAQATQIVKNLRQYCRRFRVCPSGRCDDTQAKSELTVIIPQITPFLR